MLEIGNDWVSAIDTSPEDVDRVLAISEHLRDYALIAVPIPIGNASRERAVKRQFYLLRRTDLDLAPELFLSLKGRRFRVEATHRSHEQIVDLRIQVRDAEGRLWSMRPTGEWERRPSALARTSILLHPSASARTELVSGVLPEETPGVELIAVLRTPGAVGERAFANASPAVTVPLDP